MWLGDTALTDWQKPPVRKIILKTLRKPIYIVWQLFITTCNNQKLFLWGSQAGGERYDTVNVMLRDGGREASEKCAYVEKGCYLNGRDGSWRAFAPNRPPLIFPLHHCKAVDHWKTVSSNSGLGLESETEGVGIFRWHRNGSQHHERFDLVSLKRFKNLSGCHDMLHITSSSAGKWKRKTIALGMISRSANHIFCTYASFHSRT